MVDRLAAAAAGAARARAVRRPAARRAGPAQRQREPLRPRPEVVADIARSVAEVAARPEPLPRPGVHRAARGAGGLPRTDGGDRRAGLGRQRLQRGDAAAAAGLRRPGPVSAVVRADVLDVSRVRPRHPHRAGSPATARRDFALDLGARRAPGRPSSGPRSCCCPRPTTRPAPRCRRRPSPRSARPSGDDGAGRRRRGVRRVPPRRHPERARAARRRTATWSSPAP